MLIVGHQPEPTRRGRTTVRAMTVHGMQHETSVEIAASPQAVYDLVSAVTRMGEWSPENVGADWTGGTPGTEGSTFEGHNRIGAGGGSPSPSARIVRGSVKDRRRAPKRVARRLPK